MNYLRIDNYKNNVIARIQDDNIDFGFVLNISDLLRNNQLSPSETYFQFQLNILGKL